MNEITYQYQYKTKMNEITENQTKKLSISVKIRERTNLGIRIHRKNEQLRGLEKWSEDTSAEKESGIRESELQPSLQEREVKLRKKEEEEGAAQFGREGELEKFMIILGFQGL